MVEFISYTGKWPCLCHGILTVAIDGVRYSFGHDYTTDDGNFDSFWSSGGSVRFSHDWSECTIPTIIGNLVKHTYLIFLSRMDKHLLIVLTSTAKNSPTSTDEEIELGLNVV